MARGVKGEAVPTFLVLVGEAVMKKKSIKSKVTKPKKLRKSLEKKEEADKRVKEISNVVGTVFFPEGSTVLTWNW